MNTRGEHVFMLLYPAFKRLNACFECWRLIGHLFTSWWVIFYLSASVGNDRPKMQLRMGMRKLFICLELHFSLDFEVGLARGLLYVKSL